MELEIAKKSVCADTLRAALQAKRNFNLILSTRMFLCCATLVSRKVKWGQITHSDEDLRNLVEAHEQLDMVIRDKDSKFKELGADEYVGVLLFIEQLSVMEVYFVNILNAVLKYFPDKIGNQSFTLNEVVNKSSSEIVEMAAEKYIHSLTYDKPNETLKKLCEVISIDSSVLKPYWGAYIEAKARRDLGVHNSWVCNKIYLRKVKEGGAEAKYNVGDNLVPTSDYIETIDDILQDMVYAINQAILDKFSKQPVV